MKDNKRNKSYNNRMPINVHKKHYMTLTITIITKHAFLPIPQDFSISTLFRFSRTYFHHAVFGGLVMVSMLLRMVMDVFFVVGG